MGVMIILVGWVFLLLPFFFLSFGFFESFILFIQARLGIRDWLMSLFEPGWRCFFFGPVGFHRACLSFEPSWCCFSDAGSLSSALIFLPGSAGTLFPSPAVPFLGSRCLSPSPSSPDSIFSSIPNEALPSSPNGVFLHTAAAAAFQLVRFSRVHVVFFLLFLSFQLSSALSSSTAVVLFLSPAVALSSSLDGAFFPRALSLCSSFSESRWRLSSSRADVDDVVLYIGMGCGYGRMHPCPRGTFPPNIQRRL